MGLVLDDISDAISVEVRRESVRITIDDSFADQGPNYGSLEFDSDRIDEVISALQQAKEHIR